MSDVPPIPPHDEDREQLAAEYALGVLDERERRHAEALSARDPSFAALIARWDMRLSPLVEEVASVSPPEKVWARIDALTKPSPTTRPSQATYGLAFWRWVSFGSMTVAAASIAAALLLARPTAPPSLQIAALLAPDGRSTFTAVIDHTLGRATLVPQLSWDAPGRVPELWLVPTGGVPVSLGVFDPAGAARVTLSPAVIGSVTAGVTLAVSVEPPGGSPTGQPTGPVIANGKIQAL
ncbi:anti-sigma factor [Ancylobacter sonchi]|uniref:anti-sigma factor n=1 Tax=Ancylobacter sonchi TaxID=1937790 RepID=UPI001BD2D711|nr:anti-sigma factor [Ancylobacter sonchi]MBS7534320.1 anti-sigma factor [Ancylobacter sonchi]